MTATVLTIIITHILTSCPIFENLPYGNKALVLKMMYIWNFTKVHKGWEVEILNAHQLKTVSWHNILKRSWSLYWSEGTFLIYSKLKKKKQVAEMWTMLFHISFFFLSCMSSYWCNAVT